ncbi:hypothetical protein BCR34DRAFT_570148, partial [Clohesyomyces aquaticus]
MDALPNEILVQIFAYCTRGIYPGSLGPDTTTLYNVCLVSPRFGALAQPLLYQYLQLNCSKSTYTTFRERFNARPDLRRAVRFVLLDTLSKDKGMPCLSHDDLKDLVQTLPNLEAFDSRCCDVTALVGWKSPAKPYERNIEKAFSGVKTMQLNMQESSIGSIEAVFRLPRLEHLILRRLHLKNAERLRLRTEARLPTASWDFEAPSISTLEIELHPDDGYGSGQDFMFCFSVLNRLHTLRILYQRRYFHQAEWRYIFKEPGAHFLESLRRLELRAIDSTRNCEMIYRHYNFKDRLKESKLEYMDVNFRSIFPRPAIFLTMPANTILMAADLRLPTTLRFLRLQFLENLEDVIVGWRVRGDAIKTFVGSIKDALPALEVVELEMHGIYDHGPYLVMLEKELRDFDITLHVFVYKSGETRGKSETTRVFWKRWAMDDKIGQTTWSDDLLSARCKSMGDFPTC